MSDIQIEKKVTLIRTIVGEYFVGYKTVDNDNGSVTLTQVRNLIPQMTPKGPSLAAAPVVPFATVSPDTVTIPANFVMASVDEDNLPQAMVNGYKSDISGLDLVSGKKPDIII